MKKLLVLLILCCPFIIKAQDIDNYYINATINSNGDLLVEEYIETKEENGYFERDIYYQDNYVSVENALKTSGYKLAFKYGPNKSDYKKASKNDNNFEIPRLNVSHGMSVFKFGLRLLMYN